MRIKRGRVGVNEPTLAVSVLAQRFLGFGEAFLEPATPLTGAVLRLYVLTGFFVRVGAANEEAGDAAKVDGAGAGWTFS